jgi:hypothetical protein
VALLYVVPRGAEVAVHDVDVLASDQPRRRLLDPEGVEDLTGVPGGSPQSRNQ